MWGGEQLYIISSGGASTWSGCKIAQRLGIPVKEVAVNWTEIPGSNLRVWSYVENFVVFTGVSAVFV
jgi:hypothetical protein